LQNWKSKRKGLKEDGISIYLLKRNIGDDYLSKLDKKLRDLFADIFILELLSLIDMDGVEIIQVMKEKSKGYFIMKDSLIYPILHMLEEEKSIESYWDRDLSNKTMPRKYYRITDRGREVLKVYLQEWRNFLKGAEAILDNRKKLEGK